jgi:hypothetical protein
MQWARSARRTGILPWVAPVSRLPRRTSSSAPTAISMSIRGSSAPRARRLPIAASWLNLARASGARMIDSPFAQGRRCSSRLFTLGLPFTGLPRLPARWARAATGLRPRSHSRRGRSRRSSRPGHTTRSRIRISNQITIGRRMAEPNPRRVFGLQGQVEKRPTTSRSASRLLSVLLS